MIKETKFNKASNYSSENTRVFKNSRLPMKSLFRAVRCEYVTTKNNPHYQISLERLPDVLDDIDIAIVEEIARSKYLISLQIFEFLLMRGIKINKDELNRRILGLLAKNVIYESTLLIPGRDDGINFYHVTGQGYYIAKNRGVLFHMGNRYVPLSHLKSEEERILALDVKRILTGNMIVANSLLNGMSIERFGIMETFCEENVDKKLTKSDAIIRTAAYMKIDEGSVLLYEVVRDTPESYKKIADKVKRYFALLDNEKYIQCNHHGDSVYPQLIICGESLAHNRKIEAYLRVNNLIRETDPILYTEDLLNIKDSLKSIYEIKEGEEIWYCLPEKNIDTVRT